MTKDEGTHKNIRKNIIKELDKMNIECFKSHIGKGDVQTFSENNIPLTEPDILIDRNGRQTIIEIEFISTPRQLMGIAYATLNATRYKCLKLNDKISNLSLVVVLGLRKNNKITENKKNQISEIVKIIKAQYKGKAKFNVIYYDEEKILCTKLNEILNIKEEIKCA